MVTLPSFADNDPDERYFDPAFGGWVRRLRQGDCVVAKGSEVITTLLGSCIALCLRDPVLGVGGMVHYLMPLPAQLSAQEVNQMPEHGRLPYGEAAMAELCHRLLDRGAVQGRLEAKVFGGGDVVSTLHSVGSHNIACAIAFLAGKGLRMAASDTGGTVSRRIYYQPSSGRVWVRRKGVQRHLPARKREALPKGELR